MSGRGGAAAIIAVGMALSPVGSSASEPQDGRTQQVARERLSSMATYLATLPGFEVTLVGSYDALQESGQKIEFNEVRAVTVSRPDKLRMEHLRSDGVLDLIVFDGKTMSVFNGEAGVYAQAPQPGSLDDAVVYFVRDLGMRLPLAVLLTTRFAAELQQRVTSVDYVEHTEILPVPAHHIAGRTAAVDFQVWIADGDQPLPLRIVLTYVNEPGQPQFRAQFLDWRLPPPASPGVLTFAAPADARQIPFAVQIPRIAQDAAALLTGPAGEQR